MRLANYLKRKAGARIRTADLLITNQLLYRLSYASVGDWENSGAFIAEDGASIQTGPRPAQPITP